MTLGVDASKHQKGLIDWEKSYQAGVRYGFQRASASLRRDRWYARDNLFASDVGIDCGAYHYLYPEYDGGLQAGIFCDCVLAAPRGLVVDVGHEGLTETYRRAFLECVEDRSGDAKILIYTSAYYWGKIIGPGAVWAAKYGLWVAHYKDSGQPALPDVWTVWEYWQYTSERRLPGYSCSVDLDKSRE